MISHDSARNFQELIALEYYRKKWPGNLPHLSPEYITKAICRLPGFRDCPEHIQSVYKLNIMVLCFQVAHRFSTSPIVFTRHGGALSDIFRAAR